MLVGWDNELDRRSTETQVMLARSSVSTTDGLVVAVLRGVARRPLLMPALKCLC
jgi:hypothetical protein